MAAAANIDKNAEELLVQRFKQMRAQGEELTLTALFISQDSDGDPVIGLAPRMAEIPEPIFLLGLGQILKKTNAVWVGIASEIWLAPYDGTGVRAKDRPDRREALMLIVVGQFGSRHVVWPIQDGELGEPVQQPVPARFAGLIEAPTMN